MLANIIAFFRGNRGRIEQRVLSVKEDLDRDRSERVLQRRILELL